MKTVMALLLLAAPALAQSPARESLEPRVLQACRLDIHLWCADARLRQECLVTRWTKLTNGCQDAIKVPMKAGGD